MLASFSLLALAALLAPGSSNGPPLFPRPAPPLHDSYCTNVVAADLDGDGIAEVVRDGSSGLLVARSDGLGNLLLVQAVPFGVLTYDLALADVDADGDLDVGIAAGYSGSFVSANGGGALALPLLVPVHNVLANPREIEFADVDLDGFTDLITAGRLVEVRRGDGSGAFPLAEPYHLRAPASALQLGDLDGDGRLDAAVAAEEGDALSLFRGRPDGTFHALQLQQGFGEPVALALADLNGDAFGDLLVARAADGSAASYLGDGQFHFAPSGHLGTGGGAIAAVALADVNGDGAIDALGADAAPAGGVLVAPGDGQGGLSPQFARTAALRPFSSALGDFDGDARLDAVAASPWNGGASILRAIGQPEPEPFLPEIPIEGPPLATLCSDVDLDGDLDFVVVRDVAGAGERVDTYLGDGAGGAAFSGSTAVSFGAPFAVLEDYDGDGLPDLVITGHVHAAVYKGNGSGFPALYLTTPTIFHGELAVGDFAGDPRLDLLLFGSSTLHLLVNSGQTGTIAPLALPLGSLANWTGACAGDADGDGRAEALLIKGGVARLLAVDSAGIAELAAAATPIIDSAVLRDLDGDGQAELLGRVLPMKLAIQRGLGGPTFDTAIQVNAGGQGLPVLADFDGDGGVDVARIAPPGQIEVVRTTPNGGVGAVDRYHSVAGLPQSVLSPRLGSGDFDGDGDVDLAMAHQDAPGAARIAILENVARPGGAWCPKPIGKGCAGMNGVQPALALASGTVGGAPKHVFTVTGATAASAGLLVFAAPPLALPEPTVCGSYLGTPQFLAVPFVTDPLIAGLSVTWIGFEPPPSVPIESYAAQAFIAEPGVASGFAATNALVVRGS